MSSADHCNHRLQLVWFDTDRTGKAEGRAIEFFRYLAAARLRGRMGGGAMKRLPQGASLDVVLRQTTHERAAVFAVRRFVNQNRVEPVNGIGPRGARHRRQTRQRTKRVLVSLRDRALLFD